MPNARGLEGQRRGGHRRLRVSGERRRPPARYLEQALDHRVEFAGELVQAYQRGNRALLNVTRVVPLGLDQLDVAAWTG